MTKNTGFENHSPKSGLLCILPPTGLNCSAVPGLSCIPEPRTPPAADSGKSGGQVIDSQARATVRQPFAGHLRNRYRCRCRLRYRRVAGGGRNANDPSRGRHK